MTIRQLIRIGYGRSITDSQIRAVDVPHILHGEPNSLYGVQGSQSQGSVYVGTVQCKQQKLALWSVWSAPTGDDRLAVERFSQVGCPGTPSTPSPTFQSLVESACAGGDAEACKLRDTPAS
jgi:hypothetical protein